MLPTNSNDSVDSERRRPRPCSQVEAVAQCVALEREIAGRKATIRREREALRKAAEALVVMRRECLARGTGFTIEESSCRERLSPLSK